MIIGVDVGYTYTKYYTATKQDMFRSTVQEGLMEFNQDTIYISYQGREYTIGEKGAYSVDLNKIGDTTFRMCLYTAIVKAIQCDAEEINLITGLPIAYYSKQKMALKNALENTDVFIKYRGENKVFTINQCIVFPQSAGLVILNPDRFHGDNLVIDIGGMTVDISYFEDMKLIKYATYPLGMLKLYGKIAQIINAQYGLSLDVLDSEKVLQNGLYIDDKKIDLNGDILKYHFEEILRPIKLEFPYRTSNKIFIGGGSLILQDHIPGEVNEENIYTNAKAFYQVGCEKFGN